MKNTKLFKIIACICAVVLICTGLVVWKTTSDGGNYYVEETKIQMDGYTLVGTLYIPKAALEKGDDVSSFSPGTNVNKVPALITHGGGSANRYFQQSHIVELVKRGFCVFAIDCYNHGESAGFANGWQVYSHVHDAVEYVHSLRFVDDEKVGYFGHSQGGAATIMALKDYAGYFTLEDKLLTMLYEELGVEISSEEVAEQDPDKIASTLDEADQKYYEARKAEITEDYYALRVSYGISEGMITGACPPLGNRETVDIAPAVVEVAGNQVYRNIQANYASSFATGDQATGLYGVGAMGITSAFEIPIAQCVRDLFGTGDAAVERSTLYSVVNSEDESPVQSKVVGAFDANCLNSAAAKEAAENNSLRLLVQFPGWHNTNHFNQTCISTVANFAVLATGYNNGYDGSKSIGFNDTHTWGATYAANTIAFFALILLALCLAVIVLNNEGFKAAVCEPVEPQLSKKDPFNWVFIVLTILVPVLLMPWLMKRGLYKATWFNKFDRIDGIVFWSLICTALLLITIIIKWHVRDKKKLDISFREFYGLPKDFKSVLVSCGGVFIAWFVIVSIISIYHKVFGQANIMATLPLINMPIQFTVLNIERYIDWFFYSLYFLPFWIMGGMLVTSGRMKDMPGWLNALIIFVLYLIPYFAIEYISIIGYINNGGTAEILHLNDNFVTQMCGLLIAAPIGVFTSRVLYKRTGSCIPGALLNSMLFTLPFICNVYGHISGSVPVR